MNSHYAQRGTTLALATLAALAASVPHARAFTHPADWTQPIEPFRVVGNIYYVGSRGLAAYLVVTPTGDVLIDGTVAENAPLIERNIAKLGFRVKDVKLLLNNHAHLDHAGALARLKQDSGAAMAASEGDRWALEHGKHFGDTDYGSAVFPPVKVDRVVKDGETLRLGGVGLTARLTPGHTRGCTTWTMSTIDAGRRLQVAFLCSTSVAGNVLVGNRAYPAIASDFRSTFARLKTMKADVVLSFHPEIADVLGRHRRQMEGQRDAFVDPTALSRIVAASEKDFDADLAKQQAAARAKPSR